MFEELAREDANDLLANLRLSQIFPPKAAVRPSPGVCHARPPTGSNNIEIRYNEVALLEAEGRPSKPSP